MVKHELRTDGGDNSNSPLPAAEAKEFAELEGRIEAGFDSWREVGLALWRIRQARFYRWEHTTFEAYLSTRWEPRLGLKPRAMQVWIRDSLAAQSIEAESSGPNAQNFALPKLTCAAADRAIRDLPGDDRKRAYARAAELSGGRAITEKIAKRAAKEVAPAKSRAPAAVTEAAEAFDAATTTVNQLARELAALAASPSGLWLRAVHADAGSGVTGPVREAVKTLREWLRLTRPTQLCEGCKGKGCAACYKSGWMPGKRK
jgi:hypothetical protein